MKAILDIKKRAVSNAELKLAAAKKRLQDLQNEANELKNAFCGAKNPNTLSEILLASEQIHLNIALQKQMDEKISLCEKEILHFSTQLKRAELDFERIKILADEEEQKRKKEREKKQELELDEIATMKFFSSKLKQN